MIRKSNRLAMRLAENIMRSRMKMCLITRGNELALFLKQQKIQYVRRYTYSGKRVQRVKFWGLEWMRAKGVGNLLRMKFPKLTIKINWSDTGETFSRWIVPSVTVYFNDETIMKPLRFKRVVKRIRKTDKRKFVLTKRELEKIEGELGDDTSGYLVRGSTIKYLIEKYVNKALERERKKWISC